MRESVLGIPFDLTDYDSAIEQIDAWRRSRQRRYVTLTNAHGVMLSHRDTDLDAALRGASLVLPDGISIMLAARILGSEHSGRVTGPSLMLRLCQWGVQRGYRHYFYGGADGVAVGLANRLRAAYPGIQVAGVHSPPFRELTSDEDQGIVERINAARPDVVWVGLGAPKQEKWMASHAGRIASAALIGVGAAFDFHSGNTRWAPAWIRNIGMEWAYRLVQEPRRMWRRNLGNALFVGRVLGQGLRQQFSFAHPAADAISVSNPLAVIPIDAFSRSQESSRQAARSKINTDHWAA